MLQVLISSPAPGTERENKTCKPRVEARGNVPSRGQPAHCQRKQEYQAGCRRKRYPHLSNPVLSLRETARSGRDSGDEIITTITDSASRPMSQCWSVPAGDSSFWPELNLPVMNSLPARRNRPRVRHVMTDASPRNGHSSNQASVINCGSIVSRLEADDWITVSHLPFLSQDEKTPAGHS